MRRAFNLALGMALTGLAVWTLYRVLQLATMTELGPDGGYFVVRSWQVRDGEIPYRDFYWWHTPGILYLLRYSASLFGENHASLAWQVLIQQLATLILLLAVMRRLFDSSLRPLALGATVFLASVPIFEGPQRPAVLRSYGENGSRRGLHLFAGRRSRARIADVGGSGLHRQPRRCEHRPLTCLGSSGQSE